MEIDRLIQINILQYIPNILILRQFQVICLIFSMQGTITEQLRIIILLSYCATCITHASFVQYISYKNRQNVLRVL